MNISSLIKKYPHEDAEFLLAHVLTKPREFVIAHPEYNVNFFEAWRYKKCVQQRVQGVPLAYMTRHKEFFGLDFVVNNSTLIPRPETEFLVEEVIKTLQTLPQEVLSTVTVLDIGTGSACIPIAIIKSFIKTNPEIQLSVAASDISKKTLEVAKKNSLIHKTNIQFFHGNLTEPFEKNNFFSASRTYILSANLPYLTQKQFDEEPSVQKEPYSALVAKEDGLALYKELLKQLKRLQETQKINKCILFFEIDPSQTQKLLFFITNIFPAAQTEVKKDLRNQDRVVKIFLSKII